MDQAWREGVVRTARHTSFYLDCGPADGPLLVFLHGWPELAISWRHQLPCFAAMGFRNGFHDGQAQPKAFSGPAIGHVFLDEGQQAFRQF